MKSKNIPLTVAAGLMCVAGQGRGAPSGLPVAYAPFARNAAAVRPVEFLTFPYRTGPIWSPSKETYRWAELVSGDKSVLVAGTDARVPGLDGDVGAGFGHLAFYAGKGERQKPGADFLGEVRFLLKDGASPEGPRASDRLTVDAARSAFTWARAWEANGTNGVFSYTVRADGPARIRATWDAGVDRPTWDRLRLGDRIDVSLSVPDDRPAPYRTKARTWELNPSDPARRVTLTLSEPGPTGVLTADFHTSTGLATPPLPKTGGVDFWLTDAYDVPPKPGCNLMTNGGFEQGWKGWRTLRNTPLAAVTNRPGVRFAELVPEARSGRRALKIDMHGEKGGHPAFKSAPLALEAGRTYTVSAWIRSDRGGGLALIPGPEGSMVQQTWPGGKMPDTSFTAGKDWTRHAVTFIASSQGTNIRLWPCGESIWIDDVAVVEGEDAPDAAGDPVEARLASADEHNYFHAGQARQMRLELTGRPSLTGSVGVSVQNYYRETVFGRTYPFALDARGMGEIRLDALDAAALGTGVFVVRLDYAASGVRWRDYARFTVIAPLDGTHPLAGFFAHFPWFAGGGAYGYSVSPEHADFMARRMREMGVGATSWQSNASYARGVWAPYFRTYGIVNKHHALEADLKTRHPDRFGWMKPGLKVFTNAVPEELAFIEAEAYRSAREAATNDVYWALSNEEELWHPLIKARNFDRYFEYQYACWKGLKRGFDERGLTFYYAPTHGTASYSNPHVYAILDGYLEAAKKRGFRYTCIAVHTYHAIDGSILGARDRDAGAAHLLERLAHYGYPASTPILFPEGFNILPLYIPDWGAKDWSDVYSGTIPAQSLGLREAVQAGAMARAYLIDLKRYPQLKVDHTWQTRPYMDDAFTPYMFTMVMNTLGRLLPDPRFVGDARPFPDVHAYCFRPNPTATEGVLALWTSANEVEKGLRTGDVLTLALPADATFIDLAGNARTPSARQRMPDGIRVPLTPAPLFIRAGDPQALLRAVRTATGGTAVARARRPVPFRLGVLAHGARPDWRKVAAIPLTNAVRGAVSATAKLSWATSGALAVRVEVTGAKEPVLDLSFDGLADARETAQDGWGPDDCAYRLKGTSVRRTQETNTQFRDGGASGKPLEAAEIAETLTRRWTPTADGGVWEIVFTPRFISPIRCEWRDRFGLNLAVTSAEGACSLAADERPASWPLVELK